MDFIERWFGVSPDGGNGTWEVLCIAAALLGILALAGRRRVREIWLRARS
jgi:MYXO-CTERM domain-containing protein